MDFCPSLGNKVSAKQEEQMRASFREDGNINTHAFTIVFWLAKMFIVIVGSDEKK